MSTAVDLGELAERIAEHGPVAFLVTVGDGGPHVVSAPAALSEGVLVVEAGRTTAANAARHRRVTALWAPVPARPDYCLLVDGEAEVVDVVGVATEAVAAGTDRRQLRITPDRAVLHRMADAPGQGPSCITVIDRR